MHKNVALTAAVLLTASTQASRVWFGTGGDGIYTAIFDTERGALSGMERAAEIGRPNFIALHPDLPVLYAASRPKKPGSADGTVSAFSILPDGSLTLLNQQSSKGLEPCHVETSPDGTVLMAANYISGSVVSFQILKDGSLSEPRSLHQHEGSGENPKRQEGPHAHSVFTNPQGTHAYVPDLGIDKIMIYRINAPDGTLEPSGCAEVPGGGMGPRHMKWSADGQYAYVLNELDLSLSVFKPGEKTGSLEFIATKSVLPDDADRDLLSCAEIRIHPDGKFIYLSIRDLTDQGRDAITVFTAYEADFKRIAVIPAHVRVPRNFNLDPTGRWLLAGGQRSNDLAVFKVDPQTGLIEHVETVAMKHGPICIEFAAE